jgi:hypothetical protein
LSRDRRGAVSVTELRQLRRDATTLYESSQSSQSSHRRDVAASMTRALSAAERRRELARLRKQRERDRDRAGKIRLVVFANETELIDRLTAGGFLKRKDTDDPAKIAAALLASAGCHA